MDLGFRKLALQSEEERGTEPESGHPKEEAVDLSGWVSLTKGVAMGWKGRRSLRST